MLLILLFLLNCSSPKQERNISQESIETGIKKNSGRDSEEAIAQGGKEEPNGTEIEEVKNREQKQEGIAKKFPNLVLLENSGMDISDLTEEDKDLLEIYITNTAKMYQERYNADSVSFEAAVDKDGNVEVYLVPVTVNPQYVGYILQGENQNAEERVYASIEDALADAEENGGEIYYQSNKEILLEKVETTASNVTAVYGFVNKDRDKILEQDTAPGAEEQREDKVIKDRELPPLPLRPLIIYEIQESVDRSSFYHSPDPRPNTIVEVGVDENEEEIEDPAYKQEANKTSTIQKMQKIGDEMKNGLKIAGATFGTKLSGLFKSGNIKNKKGKVDRDTLRRQIAEMKKMEDAEGGSCVANSN